MSKSFSCTYLILILTLFILSKNNIWANNAQDVEIGIVEHLDSFLPKGIKLLNEQEDSVDLLSVIDKPTVISLVYFRCPGICSPLMGSIADAINRTGLKIGEEYQVLTISFDPSETINLGKRKKKNYLNNFIDSVKQEPVNEHWKFFVSDSANIKKITDALGFKYKKSGNDYLHGASLMFLSPQGKITRYLNGVNFLPFEFKMAIVESSKGISGPTINKLLQFCYSYDPDDNKYALNITRVAGTIIMFTLLLLFLYLVIKNRKK